MKSLSTENVTVIDTTKNLHRRCGISAQQCGGHCHGEHPVSRDSKHHGNSLEAMLANCVKQMCCKIDKNIDANNNLNHFS